MKLLLLLFPLYVFAAISTIQLYVRSENPEINGRPLTFKFEEFYRYFLFVGDEPANFQYDDMNRVIFYDNKVRYFLTANNNILQLSPDTPISIDRRDDGLILEAYGVKNIDDPQGYSVDNYAIWYGQDPPVDALPLSIYDHPE
ncbi:Cell wall protein RHD3 [Candida viswanathii]|uniref:Cell wall protein RHD3 n=1 Tax=Candida viswanathii TaxID=5486 RepID=A0A367XQ37_9ASCO|nr:Cell wall protein RHD3 [Candida viswanathii]